MSNHAGPGRDEMRQREHEAVIRQRRQAVETDEEFMAMQEAFLRSGDRPAAAVTRVKPPSLQSKATTVVDDDHDDDDMPPPLEKDIVSLGDDNLPDQPPTVVASTKPRTTSKFLQSRTDKGPRTHFQSVGQRFEINLDSDDEPAQTPGMQDIELETDEETRHRLKTAGASMGQILNEVLEKPVGEAIAPAGATTTLDPLGTTVRPGKAAPKGKSLFAQRLAKAQGKGDSDSSSTATASETPSSASFAALTAKFGSAGQQKDHVSFARDTAVPLRATARSTRQAGKNSQSTDTSLPPRPAPALHSALKKTPDTPQTSLMQQIDEENRKKLANMTEEEIAEAQAELMRNLNPDLIKKLMTRGTVQRRVSFSDGIQVEGKVVHIQDAKIGHDDSNFEAKRHEEEEGDHPLALKKKFFASVPSEPEKLEWMGIEGASVGAKAPGKSIAPGPQPYIVHESDPEAAHFRFDFSGKLINSHDIPVHLGLHHHGMDPTKAGYTLSELLHLIRSTVPSQRIIPLNVVAKVINHCRDPDYAAFDVRAGILRWLIDTLRAPVYLRAAMDDKTDSGLVAAVNAIHAWAVPDVKSSRDYDVWSSLELLDRGYERINLGFQYQTITRFANMELKPDTLQASQEQGTEEEETIAAHAILAAKDPVDGLLAMNIIPRLRYILDICQLPPLTNLQSLDILLTLVRHNPRGARRVFECEGLIAALVRQYVAISWPSEKNAMELNCTVKVIQLLDIVIRSSKKYASAIIEEGHLDPLLRFLVVTPEAVSENRSGFAIQTQVLKLFRSFAAYGLYCNVLGDSLQSFLLQDIVQTVGDRSKPDLDPVVNSFLSRKLAAFFQLATAWTHAAADVHRTVPEHSLCWAQAASFLDVALDGITQWKQQADQPQSDDVDHMILVASTVRYVSTWARYLPTNPPDNAEVLERVWKALQLSGWIKSVAYKAVHARLITATNITPELNEPALPHLGISLANPRPLASIACNLFEVSLCSEYLTSHLATMFYLARLTSAPTHILQETIRVLVSDSVFGLVEQVAKYELAIQDQIPAILPPWMAFVCRHGVYFVAHWLTAMDVLVYQQDPDNSSHIKLTFFPLFQVTALSLLQMILPGDESLSHDVLLKILFNPRVLSKLLSGNTKQITVVKRILEPLYLQCFIKNDRDLKQSQSLWNHDGRGLRDLVMDYGGITAQPLFNWLFYPIEILFRSKLTYVEESRIMIAATSVAHCTLDFVYSLLQTLDGISFELIYMAALKVLALEGEREPEKQAESDSEFELVDGEAEERKANNQEDDEEGEEEEEEEEDRFMDQEVEGTIKKLLDHFSTRGDSSLFRDASEGPAPLSEKMLSILTSPLPFYQFMKNFMENCFTTGTLLEFQATAARFLFPAMAMSHELKLLIWAESFNSLVSITTKWEELDAGTLRSLIQDDEAVTPEILKYYLKAVVSGRVSKQRNPALYWIAVHHLARVAFGTVKLPKPPGGQRGLPATKAPQESANDAENEALAEERRSIVKSIVGGAKSEELLRDWAQYDARNHEALAAANAAAAAAASPATMTSLATAPASLAHINTTALAGLTSTQSPASATSGHSSLSSPAVRSPSRPLSLLTTSSSFPSIGTVDYLNSDNILTPPECFRERRQLLVLARKEFIRAVVGDQGLARVEDAILVAAPVSASASGSFFGGRK